MKKLSVLYFLILCPLFLLGQDLEEKYKANARLFYRNMDSAIVQVDPLIKQARLEGNKKIELSLLDRKCHYYYNKSDIDNLFTTATNLKALSQTYKMDTYEASAYMYIAESYSLNELRDKALAELDKAESIITKSKDTTQRVFYIKSNILISQANIYFDKEEYQKSIEKHKILVKEGDLLTNKEQYNHYQYVNYSNIANIYLYINTDSSKYYVNKSLELQNSTIVEQNIKGSNFYILGKVYEKEQDTAKAITNYLASYKILKETGDVLNRKELYESLASLYTSIHKPDSAAIFETKLKELNINELENKYNSLQKIVKASNNSSNNQYLLYVIIGSVIFLAFAGYFIVIKIQKKKAVAPATISQQELLAKNFETLVALIKKDDPSFLPQFEKIYPNFRNKLLAIEPKLTISEIQFCALLKMNLSTKKIAQLTYIETRTVQNKKHRIRKKLNIPKDIDTYNWFTNL